MAKDNNLLDRITAYAADISKGKKREWVSGAAEAFKEVKAAGDITAILSAELEFAYQEYKLCDNRRAAAKLAQGAQDMISAIKMLPVRYDKIEVDGAVFTFMDETDGYPKGMFYKCVYSEIRRLGERLKYNPQAPDTELIRARADNLKYALKLHKKAYLEKFKEA